MSRLARASTVARRPAGSGFLSLLAPPNHDTRMTFSGSLAVFSTVHILAVVAGAGPADGPAATPPPLEIYGSIRGLAQKHDLAPKVTLSDVQKSANAYGLGSLSDLRGEITIVDGMAWLAYPPAAGSTVAPRFVSTLESSERAAFLAVSHVPPPAWHAFGLDASVTMDDLQATIERLLPPARKKKGARPFAFRVEGHFQQVTLAIVDGAQLPPAARGEAALDKTNVLQALREVDGTVVGFYSPKDGAAFNHAHQRLHAHVVLPRNQASGHLKTFIIAPGATLLFP